MNIITHLHKIRYTVKIEYDFIHFISKETILMNYPFKFRTEEALRPTFYGKQVKDLKTPSGWGLTSHSIELASFYNEDIEFYLRMVPEGKPGKNYRKGYEFVGVKSSKQFVAVKTEKVNILMNSDTENELMVKLSKVTRGFKEMEPHLNHVLERVSIFYPFAGKVLQKKIIEHIIPKMEHKIQGFDNSIVFSIHAEPYKHGVEFILHAEWNQFQRSNIEKEFRRHILRFESDMRQEISLLTLEQRRKKGLVDETIHWSISQSFFNQVWTKFLAPYKKEEIVEITSKGISVGIEVSRISDEYVYDLYVKENGKSKKTIRRISYIHGELQKMLTPIQGTFRGEFADALESFYVTNKTCREHSDTLSEWYEKNMLRVVDAVGDAIEFNLYAEKGSGSDSVAQKHYLWMITTDKRLKESEKMQEAILNCL